MACDIEELKHIPLFATLDDDEAAVLAGQVECRKFEPRQRIYKSGDPGDRAYVMISGRVRVTTVDEDHQDIVVDEPCHGEFFGFASMLEQTPHQTTAMALEETICLEADAMTLPCCSSENRWPGWTCSRCWGGNFTLHSNWCACARGAIRTW